MEATARLFSHISSGGLTQDRRHIVLTFIGSESETISLALPVEALDGLKRLVDDLKLLQSGAPEGAVTQ